MIIGITGTNGAGKGTVVDYLIEKKGFTHHSVREFLLEEIRKRGLPEDRNSMRDVANELRQKHHPAHVIETLHTRAKGSAEHVIIESVRTVGETEFLKSVGAKMLAVDADRKLRYERVVVRGSSTDKISFEKFCEQEDREMTSTEPWDMNVFGVMKLCDFMLENNGSLEELHTQIDALPIFD
jgi:dephospho-CoA kinase